jgi:hypothetical protein
VWVIYRLSVLASWQWWAYLKGQVQPGKRLVCISLDETSVAYWDTKKSKGNVAVSRRAARGRATIRDIRMHLTHIAIVCDDPEVQLRLPQILLVAGAILPLYTLDEIRALLPDGVEVWRAKSGWVNSAIFDKVMQRLVEALEPFRATRQCVVTMDVFAPHFDRPVLRTALSGGLWLCFIPANMTWLLQVLDTHIFAKYKEHLRDLFCKARVEGAVSVVTWIRIICETIVSVLQGQDWGPCFARNGFSGLEFVRPTILQHIGLALDAVIITAERPSWEQLRCVFPSSRFPPAYYDLFPPPCGAAPGAPTLRRLRSKTRSDF